MASVLCSAGRTPPAPAGPAAAGPGEGRQASAATAATARRPGSVTAPSLKPRVLPRSPLANSVVFGPGAADPASSPAADRPEPPIDSSDEEDRRCTVCARFKSAEWTVQCDAAHPLCFGCVQQHVKLLLATTAACTVVCPAGPCRAAISSKHLRACLPPHRLQQLLANRQRRDRPQGILRRSLSMCTRWRSPDQDAGRTGNPVANGTTEEVLDAPAATAAAVAASPRAVPHVADCAQPTDIDQHRFSVSMPALPPAAPAAPPAFDPLLSELTRVELASLDSLVVAASLAADSTQTLNPESVGSRLRRVPKARDNLATRTWVVDGSSAAVGAATRSCCNDSQGLGPRTQSMFASGSPALSRMPPPLPPPLPAAFRASATWITPGQRNSGYAEDLLLSATLFETIRSPLSDDEDDDANNNKGNSSGSNSNSNNTSRCRRRRSSSLANYAHLDFTGLRACDAPDDDADGAGVYIPTWRKPPTARPRVQPLWAGDNELQTAANLCEAAGLTFDLYETLRR
ncbi:hypothetical protein H4R21_004264 [Coemansia helicoidea]|uniref:Uncharacterized protein n=2 Tax=Coemansia TaxID=4863 RepID=A0ACC1KZE9_9FUNG|nr:hypothetical protein H4R21_004264 [Coemansia helicoidea]